MNSTKSENGSLFFVAGLALGAALTTLFASTNNKDKEISIGGDMKKKIEQAKDNAKHAANKTGDFMEEKTEDMKQAARRGKDKITDSDK